MTTLQKVYAQFVKIIDDTIDDYTSKISNVTKSKLLFANLIVGKLEKFTYPNELSDYIKIILANPIKYFNYSKVEKIFETLNIQQCLKSNYRADESTEITNVYNNFRRVIKEEFEYTSKLMEFESLRINERAFRYLFRKYYENVSYQILATGGKYIFDDTGLYIKILGKKRMRIKLKPDWRASLNRLKEIAKIHDNSLLEQYSNKQINKQTFIDKMKVFTYNKDSNPNGEKWIVYDDKDFDYWLIINKYYTTIENGKYINITPTNFIINEQISQKYLVDNAKSVDDIIYSRELGFRDKIRGLEKFDMDYCLKTFDDGI